MGGSGDGGRPVGDFGFVARFIFGFVFGAMLGAALYFMPSHGWLPWHRSTSLWPFVLFVGVLAVVCGLLSGFLTGGKRWN